MALNENSGEAHTRRQSALVPGTGRPRALVRLFNKLEAELKCLDFEAQEFVCQVCSAYSRGSMPDTRQEYKATSKWLKRISRDSKGIERQCSQIREKIVAIPDDQIRSSSLPDEIREAHRLPFYHISLLELAGLQGPVAFFQQRSLPDPAQTLEDCIDALARTSKFLRAEGRFLHGRIQETRALWKQEPILWWQRGGLEYVLERLFRERARKKVKEAHHLIIEIRYKLDGKRTAFDTEKGYSPAIARTIKRMPTNYKKQCDKVLKLRFNFPVRH
jgi:hypothetical protein